MITYKQTKQISVDILREFFSHTDWIYESNHPENVAKGLLASSKVISAWENNKLIGFIRCFTDNIWSADIDSLVVSNEYQKQGIGSRLLSMMLKELSDVSIIYVAPNEKSVIPFYEKHGFIQVKNGCLLQIEK